MTTWPVPLSARHRRHDPDQILFPQTVNTLGSSIAQIGDACVRFLGNVRAGPNGDFFPDLKRTRARGGVVFRRGSETVVDYPDEIRLWCFATVVRCSPRPRGFWPNDTPDFVKGIRAEAGYIRDLHFYPLEIELAEEGTTPRLMYHVSWSYTYVIETKGVRLTDTLVVYLYSRDGVRRWHFYVDLANRTTP